MALPIDINFSLDPDASPARMDRMTAHFDARLRALEVPAKGLDQVLAQLQAIGLTRISDALAPVFAELTRLSGLGALFTATAATPVTVALGPQTFVLPVAARDRFAAAAYLAAVSGADARVSMTGALQSYDRTSGRLTILVLTASEPGAQAADWQISATPPPFAPVTADPGFFDGSAPPYSAIPFVTAATAAASAPDPGTY